MGIKLMPSNARQILSLYFTLISKLTPAVTTHTGYISFRPSVSINFNPSLSSRNTALSAASCSVLLCRCFVPSRTLRHPPLKSVPGFPRPTFVNRSFDVFLCMLSFITDLYRARPCTEIQHIDKKNKVVDINTYTRTYPHTDKHTYIFIHTYKHAVR